MSTIQIPNSIVSVQWLAENLLAENLILFDASMKPIVSVPNAAPETHPYIPSSLRFDFDDVLCDHNTPLPHMMPSPEFFTDEMQKMGVNQNSAIIVYDKDGIYSSPRAWWMFRAMGHPQVAVLDGGLPAWIQAGYETVPTLVTPKGHGDFASLPQGGLFVDLPEICSGLQFCLSKCSILAQILAEVWGQLFFCAPTPAHMPVTDNNLWARLRFNP